MNKSRLGPAVRQTTYARATLGAATLAMTFAVGAPAAAQQIEQTGATRPAVEANSASGRAPLKMSRRLSGVKGTPPDAAADRPASDAAARGSDARSTTGQRIEPDATQTATPPARAADGVGAGLAALIALCALVLGALLARRGPVDQTPAQDRLARELSRLRERYLGVISQREQRRDPAWDSTVATLQSDVARARSLLDNQRDQCALLQRDAVVQLEDLERIGQERDELARRLVDVEGQNNALRQSLDETTQRKATLEQWHTSTQEENRSLLERLDALVIEAADAEVQRARVVELDELLAEATAARATIEADLEPVTAENAQTRQRLAEMLDKNLALEAELARLNERLEIVDNAHARQVADLLDERRVAEQERAQREVGLQNELREANAIFVKRETDLSEQLASMTDQLRQADEAKRRVLTLLRQEKTDAAGALSELEVLRVDHARTLEQFDSVQNMLSVAEDRIDDHDRQVSELREENEQLRREISQRDTGEFRRVARDVAATRTETDGISVREHVHDDKLLRTIEQLTRSRNAAMQEVTRLRALHTPTTSGDAEDASTSASLSDARLTIRSLESDLRVRGDLIDALRSDLERLGSADAQLQDRDKEIARLRNELSMALDETSRLRNLGDSGTGRAPTRDVLRLRERLDALQERLTLKEKEIAILRSATGQEDDNSPLHEHVTRLEADQEASVTVIRFLESEVEKLSRELRASASR